MYMCHAITVAKRSLESRHITNVQSVSSAIKSVIPHFAETNYHEKNSTRIAAYSRMGSRSGSIQLGIERRIQNEYPISKQDGMLVNETPKVHIPWKNGSLSKDDLLIGVPIAERESRLRKTISRLYPKVEQTTL